MSPADIEQLKKDTILRPLNSAEDLKAWMYLYFDIEFPSGVVYPTSTHGPIEAAWRIYELFKTGKSEDIPQVCMLSSRDSYKTLLAAALEVLCMIHFRMPCCHMAAIESQSLKAVQYVNSFFRKIRPYLEAHGWKKNSDNKRMIEWITDTGVNIYLKIIVATIAGANSEHVPMLCLDGKTNILIKNNRVSQNKRSRVTSTIRGIYNALKRGEEIEAVTFNNSTGLLEFKKITSAHRSEKNLHKMSLENGKYLDMSLEHRVFIFNKGYIPLKDVKIGDSVVIFNKIKTGIENNLQKATFEDFTENHNEFQDFMIGSMLGDGCCPRKICKKNNIFIGNSSYIEHHGLEQIEYNLYKKSFLDKSGFSTKEGDGISGYTGGKLHKIYASASPLFNEWNFFKNNFEKTSIIENIGPLALAIWFQDDGGKCPTFHLSTHGFQEKQVVFLSNLINRKFNLKTRLSHENKEDGRTYPIIIGSVEDKYRLYRICKKYIHPSMEFKFKHLNKTCKKCISCNQEFYTFECGNTANYCTGIICNMIRKESITLSKVSSIEFLRKDTVYDINTEDNHNFIANGILTHNCIDEVDVVQNPKALNEAKMIPSTYGDINPLTIYLSTRKFAGGMMEKTLKETEAAGGEILRWNILDITERIPEDVSLKHLPKITRYLSRQLPLENLSPDEWSRLTDESKLKYEKFEAYAGIAEHPLLPVMKNMLADRPQTDYGFLYKRIKAVRNNFRQLPPDMGEAQLLCNKPSASGLVYSRFENHLNIIDIESALFRLTDEVHLNSDLEYFRHYLTSLGVTFIGGGDFGFTDYTSLVVLALLPNGEVWLIDSVIEQKLELDDIVKYTLELQERWGVEKWYMEQAYPAYLKTLRRKGVKCPEFTKVVADGIAAMQGKIVDSSNIRKFYIVRQPQTEPAIQAFGEYKWALDGKGDVIEGKPYHDKEGVSDIMDSLRYPFQNLYGSGGKKVMMTMANGIDRTEMDNPSRAVEEANKRIMSHKIQSLAVDSTKTEKKKVARRILF